MTKRNIKDRAVVDKINFVDSSKVFVGDVKLIEFKKAFHEEIEIKYCYQGSFGVLNNSCLNYLTEGDVSITNPYDIHANVDLGQEGRYYIIILDLDVFSGIDVDGQDARRQLISGNLRFNEVIKENVKLNSIIKSLVEEAQSKKQYYKLSMQGLTEQLISILLRDCAVITPKKADKNDIKLKNLIVPALGKIHSDYAKPLSLEELSGLCSVSVSHFCRVFKKAMGVTPVQYINAYRIDVATALLKNTDDSVGRIAMLCGFEDQSYFYRLFKLIKGVSPSQIRE